MWMHTLVPEVSLVGFVSLSQWDQGRGCTFNNIKFASTIPIVLYRSVISKQRRLRTYFQIQPVAFLVIPETTTRIFLQKSSHDQEVAIG